MKKILLIGGVLIIVLLAIFVMARSLLNKPAQTGGSDNPTTFPIGNGTTPGTGQNTEKRIQINASNGQKISVKDFMKSPDTTPDPNNSGYYYIGQHFPFDGSIPKSQPQYVIQYISSTQYFNIALTAEPIANARLSAEQYLQDHLGITKDAMCLLNYQLGVPNFVNEYYSSMELKFSFCPGAVPLK
jgi:hypothetical protein